MKYFFKSLFVLIFVICIYTIYLYSEFINKTKTSNENLYLIENLIKQNIDSFFMQINTLLSNNELIDNFNKNDYKKIELSFDNYASFFSTCELILLSDLNGNILATNTKNSRYKSFNNTELKTNSIKKAVWHTNTSLPNKLKNFNFANSFYLEKISEQYKTNYNVEILVSLVDISGTRLALLTLFYNIDAVLEILYRYNVSFVNSNNTHIGATINVENRSFTDKGIKFLNSRNIKILNSNYKLNSIVFVKYFNIYIFGILFLVLVLIIIFYFKISNFKKEKILLTFYNNFYKEIGVFLKTDLTDFEDGKLFKFNNKDIFIKNSLIDLIKSDLLGEIYKLENLMKSKDENIKKIDTDKELMLIEKNHSIEEEFNKINKKLFIINKYIDKILNTDFNIIDTVSHKVDKLNIDDFIQEEKNIYNELSNAKNVLNNLIESVYNYYILNTKDDIQEIDKLIIALKDEFFKLKLYLSNVINLIKNLNIENFFTMYISLYDNNIKFDSLDDQLNNYKERSNTYLKALSYIKSIIEINNKD